MADDGALTIETLRETLRSLNEQQADAELELFLSDDWNIYQILKNGGTIVECNGVYYAVAMPAPSAFIWDGPDNPFRQK